jgi:hypothetical protein
LTVGKRKYIPLGVGLIVLIVGTVWLVFDDSNRLPQFSSVPGWPSASRGTASS